VAGAAVDDDMLPSQVRIVWTVDGFSLFGRPWGVVTLSWVIPPLRGGESPLTPSRVRTW
jgi:hypothetical protein